MRQLEALARSAKNYYVLTDHVALADRHNGNFILHFSYRFQNFRERFGRPARRILFHFVMRFDNLGIEIAVE